MVTTTDSISPPSARIGVALMSVLTLRPSGTASTTSSNASRGRLTDGEATGTIATLARNLRHP